LAAAELFGDDKTQMRRDVHGNTDYTTGYDFVAGIVELIASSPAVAETVLIVGLYGVVWNCCAAC